MSRTIHHVWALAALTVPLASAAAPQNDRNDRTTTRETVTTKTRGNGTAETRTSNAGAIRPAQPPVIGSHQIDRYDALQKEQQAVKANPKSLADWIILGEIAHEVAMDVPGDQAGQYLKMSRDAFEKALALDPRNAGLKAAVQFARDHQGNVDTFEKSRDSATDTFLDARRRDLAATQNTPYIRTYAPPLPSRELPGPAPAPATPPGPGSAPGDPAVNAATPLNAGADTPRAEAAPAVTPARETAPATDAANFGTQANYSAGASTAPMIYAGPVYRPFATPNGQPYTYQQYSNSYYPNGLYNNPAAPPVTMQRYAPFAPRAIPNALERQILNRATTPAPR